MLADNDVRKSWLNIEMERGGRDWIRRERACNRSDISGYEARDRCGVLYRIHGTLPQHTPIVAWGSPIKQRTYVHQGEPNTGVVCKCNADYRGIFTRGYHIMKSRRHPDASEYTVSEGGIPLKVPEPLHIYRSTKASPPFVSIVHNRASSPPAFIILCVYMAKAKIPREAISHLIKPRV